MGKALVEGKYFRVYPISEIRGAGGVAKVLDAVIEPGWKNYFIKSFDWELAGKDRYGLGRLYLINKVKRNAKNKGEIAYAIGLDFQDGDYEELENARG